MATRNRQIWKLDNQGQYCRQIGWKISRAGKRSQHKFRLGSDLKEAKRREQRLIELWEQVEKLTGPTLWDETSLEIGSQLAGGQYPVVLSPLVGETAEAYARRIERSEAHFKMIPMTVSDPALHEHGKELMEAADIANRTPLNWVEDPSVFSKMPFVQLILPRRAGPLGGPPVANMTLHQAMRDFIAWIKEAYHSDHLGRIMTPSRFQYQVE